jgi:hypothetical protein
MAQLGRHSLNHRDHGAMEWQIVDCDVFQFPIVSIYNLKSQISFVRSVLFVVDSSLRS